jgi:hypothetical protein
MIVAPFARRISNGLVTDLVVTERFALLALFVFVSYSMIVDAVSAKPNAPSSLSQRLGLFP